MTLDRRSFITRTSLGCAGTLACAWATPARAAEPGNVLVAVFLRGAADGLNLVVPVGEIARYRELRPTIGLADSEMVALNGRFALHKGLDALCPLWLDQNLAIVHAAGSPHETRSHFEAMDYMERASPGSNAGPGWLNSTLVALGGSTELQGIGLGPNQLSLSGPGKTFTARDLDVVRGIPAGRRTAIQAMYKDVRDFVGATARSALTSIDALLEVDRTTTVTYPPDEDGFGAALKDAAALIKSNLLGVRVIAIELGGWDHHEQERMRLEDRTEVLAGAIAAFWQDLDLAARRRTCLVTMTEFGRTAAENGDQGTDHGHGSVMFVLGGNVRGQRVVGRWPGIGPNQLNEVDGEGRDLKVTTDFRDLFAEVLERHMGLTPARQAPIFPVAPGQPAFTVDPARYPGVF